MSVVSSRSLEVFPVAMGKVVCRKLAYTVDIFMISNLPNTCGSADFRSLISCSNSALMCVCMCVIVNVDVASTGVGVYTVNLQIYRLYSI